MPHPQVSWSDLNLRAKAFRVAHAAWGVVSMGGLGYIWFCAMTRRRDRLLAGSMALLSVEGVALLIGRGNCPFGPFQRQLGDPVPLFELVLPPRAAKAAIPILTGISLAGFLAVFLRRPATSGRSTPATLAVSPGTSLGPTPPWRP